jgi:hypothetical protein
MSRRRATAHDDGVALEVGRLALGVEHLLAARRDGAHHVDGRPARTTVGFYRILGARQVVQAVLLIRAGTPEAHTLGAAVDAVHAISMLPLMLLDRKRRGVALSQFVIAGGLAVAEAMLVGRGGRTRRG